MRLIDLDEAIKLLRGKCVAKYPTTFLVGLFAAADELSKLPEVDAVPVVRGRWIDNGICDHKPSRFRNPDKWTIYKCSECGYSNGRRKNANYCPNCGAKMDGERRNDDG